jgi:inner membrane protein
MSPITHFFTGWLLANTARFRRRERALVTAAAVVADVDGFGALPEALTENSAHPLTWYTEYHHALHTAAFAVLVAAAAWAIASRRWKTALFALLAFHLHLLQDVAGSRSFSGYQWPIPYLRPFSNWQWTWTGQWTLNGWQNLAITACLLLLTLWLAWAQGRSPVELFSPRADAAVVAVLRRRGWLANRANQ